MILSPFRRPARGFTLLELLVAISILALLAVFSWRTLDAITRTSDALRLSGDRIDNVARVFAAFDEDSQNAQSADIAVPGSVRFLAAGGSVDYHVQDGVLLRHLPGQDPAPIANGVADMHIDLIEVTPTRSQAPLAANAAQANQPQAAVQLPKKVVAVKISLDLADGGSVTRLLLLNSA